MKKIISLALCQIFLLLCLCSCLNSGSTPVDPVANRLRLSNFVGVWTNESESRYYRFTTNNLWYCYNVSGEVERNGELDFDGQTFTLTDQKGETVLLTAQDEVQFFDENNEAFRRTDSPSSLMSSEQYGFYFDRWFEEGNLEGNVLSIAEPDVWVLKNSQEKTIAEGRFYAYAGEEENLYLYDGKTGSFFARLLYSEDGLVAEKQQDNRVEKTIYRTEENSTVRHFYFKEKEIDCDYFVGDGTRLLRNGGAVYNDAHDYKKMPVSCQIDITEDKIDQDGQRQLNVVVIYEFKRKDLPAISGSRIYNSVRFSQYDYYTGELFYLDDSTGNENLTSQWETEHDGQSYTIQCDFSSKWDYSSQEEVFVRWQGTYQLTMPRDYDGFVICLRPVFNSYSAQITSSVPPQEGTLLMEDLGEDVSRSIFCRIERNLEDEE